MDIRRFDAGDSDAVVALWEACGLTRPWNDPRVDIARKLTVQPELFLVGEIDGHIVASAMAGYDGHRGWMNYLAVEPTRQNTGLGRQLVTHVEERLAAMGCPKANLQVRTDNDQAVAFYQALGYETDDTISLGKRLIHDASLLPRGWLFNGDPHRFKHHRPTSQNGRSETWSGRARSNLAPASGARRI